MTFNIAACRRFARFALANPPAAHIDRQEPQGLLVSSFILPLELCPTLNAYAQMPHWKRAKIKGQLLLLMRAQQPHRLPTIPGRPWARAIRFSSVEGDADNAFAKMAIDRLTPKNHGLGLIADDRPKMLSLHTWWEPAPRGAGFVQIDVFTGKAMP